MLAIRKIFYFSFLSISFAEVFILKGGNIWLLPKRWGFFVVVLKQNPFSKNLIGEEWIKSTYVQIHFCKSLIIFIWLNDGRIL